MYIYAYTYIRPRPAFLLSFPSQVPHAARHVVVVYMYIYVYTQTHLYVYVYVYIHTYIRTYIHLYYTTAPCVSTFVSATG